MGTFSLLLVLLFNSHDSLYMPGPRGLRCSSRNSTKNKNKNSFSMNHESIKKNEKFLDSPGALLLALTKGVGLTLVCPKGIR